MGAGCPVIDTHIDIPASVVAARTQQLAHGMVKTWNDLDRYEKIIAASNPETLIECGTWSGHSALWFSQRIPTIVSIDVENSLSDTLTHPQTTVFLTGDSTAPDIVDLVSGIVGTTRVMVVLDSDHHAEHVAEEIRLYGPLVTPGCYLVVEDGIAEWMDEEDYDGPLYAIERELADNPDWRRDIEIERMSPISMHPGGWWEKL